MLQPIAALKDGNVHQFEVLQNTATYLVKIAHCPKGLWMTIEESMSLWKLTITEELLHKTVLKASAEKETLSYKDFTNGMWEGLKKISKKWAVGVMTPVQLQLLRGKNTSSTQAHPTAGNNKIYLILSDKEKKLHFPFTFSSHEVEDRDKLMSTINTLKRELDKLKLDNRHDKTNHSFSVLNENDMAAEQIRAENQELKKQITLYEESLTQKRGAVEIDQILKEKNNLEIKAETKRREEARQIARLKGLFQIAQRQNKELRAEVETIVRELSLLEESATNPNKIKSHALKVLKSYDNDLRTAKKIVQKQTKDIETIKRNLATAKNAQKKQMTKIKQIQAEIEDSKKKANITAISNRLHSPGRNSNASSSQKAPSETSSKGGRANSINSTKSAGVNLVRVNLLRKQNERTPANQNLIRTQQIIGTPTGNRKALDSTYPARPARSSHEGSVSQKAAAKSGPFSRNSPKKSFEESLTPNKRSFSPEDKEKQKKAMERLTGPPKPMVPMSRESASKVPPASRNNVMNRQAGSSQQLNQKGRSLPSKAGRIGEATDPQSILNRMKQVKAMYNGKIQANAAKDKSLAERVAAITGRGPV